MPAFEITTQTSEVIPLDRRGRGQAKFLVANRTGRNVRASIRAEPEGDAGARSDWLVVDRTEHGFAPGAGTVITVEVGVPAGTPGGRYPFRLVVATDVDEERTAGAPVWLRYESSSRALWTAVALAAVVLVASGVGLYRWLTTPSCPMERAVYDDSAGSCVCPAGMIDGQIGDRHICLCESGTDYDEGSGTCVPRACEVQGALYSEAAGACSCPPGTLEAATSQGRRCVCPLGQAYDPETLACVPRACASPERSRYDERSGTCECPEDMQPESRPDTGTEVCECTGGRIYDERARRCVTRPNLRVERTRVFPPLRLQRQFVIEVAVENAGEGPAGPWRLEVVATGGGLSFRDEMEGEELAPGGAAVYQSRRLRVVENQPVRIQARVEAVGFEEMRTDDNEHEKTFELTEGRYAEPEE